MRKTLQQISSDSSHGVYFIGTTPPKKNTDIEKVSAIADKLLSRLDELDYDGLIVYDIQDESSRIDKPRPFPYMQTHDPRLYAQLLMQKSQRSVITYKSVSQRNEAEFVNWLKQAWHQYGIRDLVLVGSPAANSEIKLSLADAYQALANQAPEFYLGGVTIAERHAKKGDEHLRLLHKMEQGCRYFVSQAVYNAQATIDMLSRYAHQCRENQQQPQRIILTFSPCGSAKTLEFIEWLGISVPEATSLRILNAEKPLNESILICYNNLVQILETCLPLGIPLGLNIESLTNRKEEIDASILLYKLLKATMDKKLAQQQLR
ncbi:MULTISPECIES: methylenetetrahydrofolate reductase [unclassified Agarivorans]|uniref:methylenetetrahydrofolate reductase n=1 Tax=unclassified Agarivorans TaxID=2636026 RepID=UPI003D7EC843